MGFHHLSPEKRRELGKKGAANNLKIQLAKDPNYLSKIGSNGGKAVVKKYGSKHMAKIARLPRRYSDE